MQVAAISGPQITNSVDLSLREKASEFEGILLAEVLQKLRECYQVPGAEDSDSAGENYQSLAISAMSGGVARRGGIGLAEMLVSSLESKPDLKGTRSLPISFSKEIGQEH